MRITKDLVVYRGRFSGLGAWYTKTVITNQDFQR